MVSIRGPRSALTDYIKEQGLSELILKNKKSESTIKPTQKTVHQKITKKTKKQVSSSLPTEIVNISQSTENFDQILIDTFIKTLENPSLSLIKNDEELSEFSRYLSLNRKMDQQMFIYICENSQNKMYIYDCADIPNHLYHHITSKSRQLQELHLFFCGQLSTECINEILKNAVNLKKLTLKGGHLITDLNLPESLTSINLAHCSRLKSHIIKNINENFEFLELLDLSYCENLNSEFPLKTKVRDLSLEETYINEDFFQNVDKECIKSLNISMCPYLYPLDGEIHVDILDGMSNLQTLNISGISTIKTLPSTKITTLNASACHELVISSIIECKDIIHLDISKRLFSSDDLCSLTTLQYVEFLDVSWIENFEDEIFFYLVDKLTNLKIIHVYGCFSLTTAVGEFAWLNKDRICVVGNPAETRYLLCKDTQIET